MNIITTAVFKDGGTKMIETEEGIYWLPCDSVPKLEDRRKIFKGENYYNGRAIEVTDHNEIINLLHSLCYESERYHHIKRAIR